MTAPLFAPKNATVTENFKGQNGDLVAVYNMTDGRRLIEGSLIAHRGSVVVKTNVKPVYEQSYDPRNVMLLALSEKAPVPSTEQSTADKMIPGWDRLVNEPQGNQHENDRVNPRIKGLM